MLEAKSEFVFKKGFYLVELTGKKAENLKEFLDIIKTIDNESLFYHMYHSLLEHHFIIPDYFNDFAHWLGSELHEDALAEKVASVGIYEYGDIGAIRQKLISLLEERLKVKKASNSAPEGGAFHFVKSRLVVLPTKYKAKNLKEFLRCLKKIDGGTLFYHFFVSRLRFAKAEEKYVDDFSRWAWDSLESPELADELAKLDPYGYTLNGIRDEIIKIIERFKGSD